MIAAPSTVSFSSWSDAALGLMREFAHGLGTGDTPNLREASPDQELALRERYVDVLSGLGGFPQKPALRLYNKIWSVHRGQVGDLVSAFGAKGLPFVVLKGAELTMRYFDKTPLGYMADVDCLVDPAGLSAAKNTLFELGFRQGRFDPSTWRFQEFDIRQIASMESVHFELAPFCRMVELDLAPDEVAVAETIARRLLWTRDGRTQFELMIDVHHGFAADMSVEEAAVQFAPSVFHGATTLSMTDHLWLISSKYYTEVAMHGKKSLRDFLYLAAIIKMETIDWDRVIATVEKHALHTNLYYYLRFSAALAGIALPADVLTRLSPTRGPRYRDWGWQIGPLFDTIEAMPFEGVIS